MKENSLEKEIEKICYKCSDFKCRGQEILSLIKARDLKLKDKIWREFLVTVADPCINFPDSHRNHFANRLDKIFSEVNNG